MIRNIIIIILIFFASCFLFAEGKQELPHIHTVVKSGSPKDLLEAIRAGEDINEIGPEGRTPLFWAAKENPNPADIEMLIEYGAYLEAEDDYGMTPLSFAADNNNYSAVKRLIDFGADVNKRDKAGMTPLMRAAWEGTDIRVVELLLDKGALIGLKDNDGYSALHRAGISSFSKNSDIVSLLLDRGADIHTRSNNGETPFMSLAANFNQFDIILRALELGADVNAIGYYGWTPLIMAGIGGCDVEVFRLLLKNGADITVKNREGKTAYDYAKEYPDFVKNVELLEWLRVK